MEDAMKTLTITLPPKLKTFIDDQVTEGKYADANACITALIHAERKRVAELELIALVQEAEASGPPTPVTPETWERIRREGMRRLAEEKAKRAKSNQKARSRR
jgi:putative addiction module CopG family antidote